MARALFTLTLQSIGYSGQRIGSEFAINIAASPGGDAFADTKTIKNGDTPTYTDEVVNGVFEVPASGVMQVDVAATETKESIPDPGSMSGQIPIKLDDTASAFVTVPVNGQGGDKGKKASLRFGFLLKVDCGPERFTELCALLRSLLSRFGSGANQDRLRTELLRIAWHETGLTARAQSGGPARGIYQMQANGARSALTSMRTADPAAYAEFARLGGFTDTAALDAAVQRLGGSSFGTNPIGAALASSDECATLAAIAGLRAAFGSLPAESDIQEAANFWETYWHIVPDAAKKKEFVENAEALDRIRKAIPAAECGLGT